MKLLGVARISDKNRITLSKEVRNKLKAGSGDLLLFFEDDSGNVLICTENTLPSGKSDVEVLKLLVTGPYNAGKSTIVSNLSRKATSIDALQTTVGFDFGRKYDEINVFDLHIFGTPGHTRFAFMQEILAKGSAGVLLVVDSTNPETFSLARDILYRVKREISENVPVVILANKQDLEGAMKPEDVAKQLSIGMDVPVVGTVATQNQGLREALQLILKQISKMRGKERPNIS
ncbi:MAG: GTP-binding protein [Candidatus Freyarchaeota archaeon]|nr:GTP-binding protein [Candidatus Jordarchaeia archaeon]MBS7269059.1 GTP-binding protein [Candidatus Jordarchaeia archaeon]MBS7279887.1 GTP-binding protein [Candidatus Jordarchaeia archaeon]